MLYFLPIKSTSYGNNAQRFSSLLASLQSSSSCRICRPLGCKIIIGCCLLIRLAAWAGADAGLVVESGVLHRAFELVKQSTVQRAQKTKFSFEVSDRFAAGADVRGGS